MFKIGDKVKVEVSKFRFIGEIVELENDIATVKVPTYYGKQNQEYLVVKKDVKELWGVIKDLEDYKKHKGMWNLK